MEQSERKRQVGIWETAGSISNRAGGSAIKVVEAMNITIGNSNPRQEK
ncbi:hypothetical protein CCACVL1_26251 [Corchorus capsularis]|uniref:Uncharacterized protein n=2 Tax=Corchorus TaxID=93758 RepID=A0A1R3GFG1_COCAP|nr:hypothetical protein CCACVL1_26251 [Corchorus capsularis]OMO84204.1 F-box associated ubiquitination effector-like protein [Corchorus olitorius]